MALDHVLLPNLKNVDPRWRNLSLRPGRQVRVIKDYGITLFFYRNEDRHGAPEDDARLLQPAAEVREQGAHEHDGAAPRRSSRSALMALGVDPNTGEPGRLAQAKKFLMRIRPGVTTITSSNYINDASAGKIILGQGWNGDVRRVATARKKQGDITVVVPAGATERWADNWCITKNAPHPVAAHAWINNILDPKVAAGEILYHNYAIPIPKMWRSLARRRWQRPAGQRPGRGANNYKFILNPQPGDRERAHEDLHGVQGRRLMAVAEAGAPRRPPRRPRRARSFAPRYPAWLTAPSFVYYAVFFLAPLAILVVFSFAREPTRSAADRVRVRPVAVHGGVGPAVHPDLRQTLLMAGRGTLFTILVGYPIAYWMARYLTRWKSLGAAAGRRPVLDVVPDPHLRAG